jgi:hypothetical protein
MVGTKTKADRRRNNDFKTSSDAHCGKSHVKHPKSIIHPLPYRVTKLSGYGDLLSRSPGTPALGMEHTTEAQIERGDKTQIHL